VRALELRSFDGPDALELAEVPDPSPRHAFFGGETVLIEVHAAGVAFPDLLMTRGQYQRRLDVPFVPGYEVAGVVRAAPSGGDLDVGERVAAMTVVGGFAELAVAPAFGTFRLADRLSFAEGAGLILNYHTAYFALRVRGGLRDRETLLVHGAAGGVGSAALQVARGLGARSIAVVSSDEKEQLAREAGADQVLRADGRWREQARELTGGRGVDVVLDPVGGERFTDSIRSLGAGGRVVVVGFTEGSIPEVKVNRLLLTNTGVLGAAWTEYVQERPDVAREIGRSIDGLVDQEYVRPLIGQRFPLERAADALHLIDRRGALGKVILDVRPA
jgi:NADPH:quinone reductase